MVLNKIVRRCGIYKTDVYKQFTADMIELFDGFNDVTHKIFTPEEEEAAAYTEIYLDSEKRMYIKMEEDSTVGLKVSFHLGDGTTVNRDYISIDSSSSGSKVTYSFVKTPYGAAFSPVLHSESDTLVVQDGNIRSFFSVFEDESGEQYNGFVYVSQSNDDTGQAVYTMATPLHSALESMSAGKMFLGTSANQNVLCNASSYAMPLVASRLYKKLQTEGAVFGKIKIGGKMLIAGSHFALECVDD